MLVMVSLRLPPCAAGLGSSVRANLTFLRLTSVMLPSRATPRPRAATGEGTKRVRNIGARCGETGGVCAPCSRIDADRDGEGKRESVKGAEMSKDESETVQVGQEMLSGKLTGVAATAVI